MRSYLVGVVFVESLKVKKKTMDSQPIESHTSATELEVSRTATPDPGSTTNLVRLAAAQRLVKTNGSYRMESTTTKKTTPVGCGVNYVKSNKADVESLACRLLRSVSHVHMIVRPSRCR